MKLLNISNGTSIHTTLSQLTFLDDIIYTNAINVHHLYYDFAQVKLFLPLNILRNRLDIGKMI